MTDLVSIERLHLRVSGMDRAAAARLGEDVARELAAGLSAAAPARPVATLRVRVTGPADAAEIVRHVAEGLR